ncbi:MAG: rod shape-determining protein MreD [Clostridiaceae bacterium]|nr:rod shape-determining protein MreD [Clostridiaceae bacterium]
MKRYLSMFLLIVLCFVAQTSIFPHLALTNIIPNLMVVLTAVSGFMHGRKFGMYSGFVCGVLVDFMYSDVIGVSLFIFVLIGYLNGVFNKLYFKDDLSIPLFAIAFSDIIYGLLYYICNFLLRGRFQILYYIKSIMIPEMIYTILTGIVLYHLIHWIEDRLYPPQDVPLGKGDKINNL